MLVALLLTVLLGEPPLEAWPRVRDAFPELAGARVELSEPGRLVVRLPRDELDPAVYDAVLAALVPHSPTRILTLEVLGPSGVDLAPAPLSSQQITRLSQLWRAEHRPRSAGRQLDDEPAGTLDGVRVAVSAGHGTRWDDGWSFQRSVSHQLREDLHTNAIVLRHLAPMLERAGAEVVLVRERSGHPQRIVVDNDGNGTAGTYREEGEWLDGSAAGHGGTYRYAWVHPDGGARAIWQFAVTRSEEVPLYVWYRAGTNRSGDARFEIEHAGGTDHVEIDQRRLDSRWRYLGTFPFVRSRPATVTLTNVGSDTESVVVADAVRLAGGAGFADYGGGVSGRARWQQSASTFVIEEEVPALVTNETSDVNVRPSVALWQGADLFVSVHTNAAGGRGTSSFVYSSAVAYPGFDPNRATPLPPGTLELQEAVHSSMLETFRARWDSEWNDRGLWGAAFGELRPLHHAWQADPSVVVPATLVEIAFHDNPEDAFFLREDKFRRDAARAILRGIIQFVHRDAPVAAVVPPSPPSEVVARQTAWGVELSWRATPDPVDAAAAAEWYEVEIASDGWSFGVPMRTVDTRVELRGLSTCDTVVARVVAGNGGGRSMPSRAAVARVMSSGPRVLWVDGVRRLHRTAEDAPAGPNTAARVVSDLSAALGGGLGIDSARVETIASGAVSLADWDVVLWSTGETSSYDGTLRPAEQAAVALFLGGGGALALSGAEIGWDLVERGDTADQAFFADVLHAAYVDDDADAFEVVRHADATWLPDLSLSLDDGTGVSYRVEFPDVLAAYGGSVAELAYPSGGVAALRAVGAGRLFLAGFPLEAIETGDQRRAVIEAVISNPVDAPVPQPICGIAYGEPAGSDGGPAGPDGGQGGDDTGGLPSEVEGGCGCAGASAVVWWLALVPLAGRRQRARA